MRLNSVLRTLTAAVFLTFFSLGQAQVTAVRINEVLANNTSITNADGSVTDLLELFNTGVTGVDLSGCSLSDSNTFPRRYVFPPGSVVQARGFKVLICDSAHTNSTAFVPFGIRGSGGFLYFYGPQTNLIDFVEYGLQVADYSIGRVTDGTGPYLLSRPTLGTANVPVSLGVHQSLKVNEWMANPSSGKDYFEIYNGTNLPVSLSGMYLTDTAVTPTKFRIPELSFIGTGALSGFIKFTADGDASTPKYPADEVNFKLSNGGEAVGLYETNSAVTPTVIDYVSFGAQASGVSQGRLPDGSATIVSFPTINGYDTASPGEANFLILTNVFINELLSHTDPPLEDAVEIRNAGPTNINVSGWWLSNSRNNRKRYQIPNGAAIATNGFRVIYEGFGSSVGFNSSSALDPFTFNSARGDNIVVSQVDANGNLTGYIMYEEFESAANGVSFGRHYTSVSGDYKFVAQSLRTFGVDDPNFVQEFRLGLGETNAYPKIGPLVINEIMFRPSNTTFYVTNINVQNPEEEYIEIRNITSVFVPLYDPQYPTNHWKLQKAVEYVFPLTNLGPNQFCLVVGFDPQTNPVALANFRARFGVSNDIPIFGPWIGRLSDTGDSVELYRPDPVQLPPHPDAGYVPYIRVDKVNFSAASPWPVGAVGTGRTLQRKNSLLFGNDPINWAADNPTAGRPTSSALQDTDGDGIPDSWETANNFNPNNPADALVDTDGDSISNLGEYLAGTNPRDASSVLKAFEVIPSDGISTPLILRFLAYSNTTYSVEYRNSLLPSATWRKLADVPAAANNRVVDVLDSTAYTKSDRYYRIVAPASN